MESIYTELALYGSKNECARTENVFFPISEVCDGTISLESGGVVSEFLYRARKCPVCFVTLKKIKLDPFHFI